MSHNLESLPPFRRRLWLPLLGLVLVLVCACVVIGLAQRTPETSANAELNRLNSQSADREAKALLFAVQPYGFEPTEMVVEEGRYLLVVQNRSGLDDLLVTLQADDATKVHEEHTQRRQWRKRFDLKKGTYRLIVENHPEWSCVIRVN